MLSIACKQKKSMGRLASGFSHEAPCLRGASAPRRVAALRFFVMAEKQSVVCTRHILFFHSFVRGYLNYFHILAVVSNAAVNWRAGT